MVGGLGVVGDLGWWGLGVVGEEVSGGNEWEILIMYGMIII